MMQGTPHDRLMSDPAMRQPLMERMRQRDDLMSHMEQAEHPQPQPQPR